MKKIALIALLILGIASSVFIFQDHSVLAAAKDEVCSGVGAVSGTGGCSTNEGPSINTIIVNVVNILSLIVGIVSVIMIIIAGFRYVTSGGDSGSISTAKNTIIYAIVGLVVVAFSQTIVKFVLSKV